MLTQQAAPADTLWDSLLSEFVRTLPDDLARLDQVLDAPGVLKKFEAHWGRANLNVGRPSIPMASYLRLMALKHHHGWGYERLIQRVADSFHLRRFCRISIQAELPDESTVRKLTRRLGPELVADVTREVITLAVQERGFKARALRCDSTVQEADVRYPTDAGLAVDAVQVLARQARRVRQQLPGLTRQVQDRSRAAGKRLRALGRTLQRRSGDAKAEVQRLTEEIASLARAAWGQARKLLGEAQAQIAGSGPAVSRRVSRTIQDLEEAVALSGKVVEQVRQRFAGDKIADRLVSLYDPQARPIRKGKKATPTQFGYMVQYAELAANTRGARGLLVPPSVGVGSLHEDKLLPKTAAEVLSLGLKPVEAVFDGGFTAQATAQSMAELGSRIFIAGSPQNTGSRRTRKRLAAHRVGCEGRISHLKREFGARRSRLKGEAGARIWAGWTALAYDLSTVSKMPVKARPEP